MLVRLDIEARSPLAFAQTKPGAQFRQSQPFIPGAVIYGALGRELEQRREFDAEAFEQLRCHNAYPLTSDETQRHLENDNRWVRPLPTTVMQGTGVERAPRRDSLVSRVCWERQQPAALIYGPTDDEGRAWERAEARFYTLENNTFDTHMVPQRVLTRVAINRRRGTAEDQRLYSPVVLNEAVQSTDGRYQPAHFRGSVVLPDNRPEMLAAIRAITRVGGRQSTGLGAITVADTVIQPETWRDVQWRVAALTTRFQRQAARYGHPLMRGSTWNIDDETIFTVNLLADTILLEDEWLPTNELSAKAFAARTGIGVELVRGFATTTTVGGWNVSWQRPKPTALAVVKGSLFVFKAQQPLAREHYESLAALQYDGIGERRQEGYGQIRICDDLHLLGGHDD